MKKIPFLLISIALVFLLGCASKQRVFLLDPNQQVYNDNRVSIVDLRNPNEKEIRYNLEQDCERWYGDVYMQPGKIEVLKQTIYKNSADDNQIDIKLKKFDTVEVCVYAAQRAVANAQSAAVSAAVSQQSGVPLIVSSSTGVDYGDYFRIQIAGEVNDKPFDVALEFGYGDLKFDGSFDANEVYVGRIRALLNEVVKKIVDKAN